MMFRDFLLNSYFFFHCTVELGTFIIVLNINFLNFQNIWRYALSFTTFFIYISSERFLYIGHACSTDNELIHIAIHSTTYSMIKIPFTLYTISHSSLSPSPFLKESYSHWQIHTIIKSPFLYLLLHLVHAPSSLWRLKCSFTFVTLYVLFWLIYVPVMFVCWPRLVFVPWLLSFDFL